jgi:CheY-like chemotaxis protein
VACPARPAPVRLEICEECEHVTAIAEGASSFVACRPPSPARSTSPIERARGKRILVIDENLVARSALAELLIEEGYEVNAVATGAAGARALAELPADLVLADHDLPGDQAAALKEAIGNAPHPPAIVWMVVRSAEADARCVIKPIVMPDLLRTIERALQG